MRGGGQKCQADIQWNESSMKRAQIVFSGRSWAGLDAVSGQGKLPESHVTPITNQHGWGETDRGEGEREKERKRDAMLVITA